MAEAGNAGSTLLVAGLTSSRGSGSFSPGENQISDVATSGPSGSFKLALIKLSGSGRYSDALPPAYYRAGVKLLSVGASATGQGKFKKKGGKPL